jgi:hypothetical protein
MKDQLEGKAQKSLLCLELCTTRAEVEPLFQTYYSHGGSRSPACEPEIPRFEIDTSKLDS